MTANTKTRDDLPHAIPYLFYDDLEGAVRFLGAAFGFDPTFVDREEGKITHATLRLGPAAVMLGPTHPRGSIVRPSRAPAVAGSINAGVYLFVDDVDAHCLRARGAGAEIAMEPADMHWGDRLYCALDREGQLWMFATPTREVGAAQ
jgi:uncharacterized glyoxalase superfamily protein PhnB